MTQLPIVEPFEILAAGQVFRFTDTRTDTGLRMAAGSAFVEFANTIAPRDLLCRTTSTLRHDLTLARQNAWTASGNEQDPKTGELTIEPELLADEIAKFAEFDRLRHSVEIFRGDVDPLNFAVEQGGRFVGGWQWYAIRLIAEGPRPEPERRAAPRQRVRCGWFPALLGLGVQEVAELSIDLVAAFVRRDRMMVLRDGRVLDIVQATAPTVEVGSRDDTRIIQFARERLEALERDSGLNLSSRDQPGEPGRKRVRVTDFGVDSIDEPEIRDLEARQ